MESVSMCRGEEGSRKYVVRVQRRLGVIQLEGPPMKERRSALRAV